MFPVTSDYQNSIYSSPRTIFGRVTFDISPSGIEDDTPTITTTGEYFVSDAAGQLTDNIRQATRYLVSWETDRTLLDGTFTFPSSAESEWGQVGFVSSGISASNNEFVTLLPLGMPPAMLSSASYPTITMVYANSYTSAGITITFDTLFNEYATDFIVTAYNASDVQVFTTTITGNTLTQYVISNSIVNFKKITVAIKKWSIPERRARVMEIDAGVVLVYENDRLIRMNSTEELDPLSSSLVIPEFSFTVDNTDGEFDILNPSGIYSALQLRQRIQAEYGLQLTDRVEWIPLGIYYLSEWRSDTGAMTATFRGRSKIDILENQNYENLTPMVSYSLYDMAVNILDAAGVTGYSVDIGLDSVLTNGLIKSMTCKEALQYVAMAGTATIHITRNDILTITQYSPLSVVVDSITFDEIKEEPQIEQGKAVASVSVSYYTDINTVGGIETVTNPDTTKGEVIKLDTNTLINTSTRALEVANWLNDVRSNSKEVTVEFRGNPALELNDSVQIENRYTLAQIMDLTKIDLSYEGYLFGQLKGRTY